MPYASVYPLVSSRAVARPFTYEVPPEVGKGAVVSVRFGGAKRRGVVVGLEESPPEGVKAAPVGDVVDELPEPLVDLALWLADYYGSTPARALELVAPPKRKARGERPQPAERDSLGGEAEPARLSESQQGALARIVEALDGGGGNVLLHGATGSGKTEVYLQACAAALERGKGAIVLVPEIALAPQTVGRLRARFGDRVAVLHSSLTEAERRDERVRIASGAAPIVVGARSAVFAAVAPLGVICVDEEHDPSYKQDADPRYDARTVAAKRAALEDAVAIFGTATPRPESWERLERLELGGRLAGRLPPVRVVDLRREAGYPLSAPLLAELGALEQNGGKAILLLNRRGVAPAVHCRACGLTRRCPNCDVALVLHADGRLHCHHCSLVESMGEACPECGSPELARIGAGTQRLEQELAEKVPELERIRLDADAVRRPAELTAALRRFAETDRAVLVGTQMVAKGHHFAGVALAAVVDADTGLGMPDFRAEERTFQLVTQLAGRSGRDAPGPRDRPDVPAGRSSDRSRGSARRHALPRRGARAPPGARLSAFPPSRSGPRRRPRGRRRDAAPRRDRRGPRRRRRPRPRAAPAPARPPPRAAPGQDRAAAAGRLAGRAVARRSRAGDAPRGGARVVDVDPQGL